MQKTIVCKAPPKKRQHWLKKLSANSEGIAMVVGSVALLLLLYVFFKSPSLEKLQQNLVNGNRQQQLKSIKRLEKYSDQDALAVLFVALSSKYPKVRKMARTRLANIGEDAVDPLLENFAQVKQAEGQIAILELASKYGNTSQEARIRKIVNFAKTAPLKNAAIQCLVALNPENKTDFSRYQGNWYSNWDLEEELNCLRIGGKWRSAEELVRESIEIRGEAKELVKKLRQREERDFFLSVEHPYSLDFEKWNFYLSFYSRSLDKLVPLQKYQSKAKIRKMLSDVYTETSEQVKTLLQKLTEIGEEIEQLKPGYGYRIYEQVEDMYQQILSYTWNSRSLAKLEQALKIHRQRMEKCKNRIQLAVVAKALSDDNAKETEKKLRKSIEYIFRRDNRLVRFIENPMADMQKHVEKWCEFTYSHDTTGKLNCRFSYWYKRLGGKGEKIWEKRLTKDYLHKSYAIKQFQGDYWQELRNWHPRWKAMNAAYSLAISQKIEKQAPPESDDSNESLKTKGSTWNTQQDVIYLKNGKKRKGFIKKETKNYLELVYFYRPSRDTIMVAREKISRKKITKIERIDNKERKQRLNEIENLKKQLAKEKQAAYTLKLQSIPWAFVKGTTGWKYTGSRFVLRSNVDKEYVRTISYQVQLIFDAYERFFKVERNQGKKIEIYIFGSMGEYYRVTGGKIKNPAFYIPEKNLIAAGCDLARYKAEVEKSRNQHNNIRKQIKEQRRLITQYKNRLKNDIKIQMKQLSKKLRLGQINRVNYGLQLKSLKQQRISIQKSIRKYQGQLRQREDKLQQFDYQNKKLVEKYTGNMIQVLYHESFHAFLQNFLFEQDDTKYVPLWLNEGMAQFFENSFTSGGKLRVGKMGAKRVKMLKQYIYNGSTISLPEFLIADSREFLVTDPSDLENSTIHYLQSWAIVYCLIQQYNLRSGNFFDSYVKELKNGENPVIAFQHLVEISLDKFDKKWKQAILEWK